MPRRELFAAAGLLLCVGATRAQGYDFNEQFLVAGCASSQPNRGIVTRTANGVGVAHRPGSTQDVVLYCPIDASDPSYNYFNWLQIVAEDDTALGSATATLYRQAVGFTFAPPEVMYAVTTSNAAGVQTASNSGLDDSLDEYTYMYWIEVRLARSDPAATIVVYNVAIMDVL